MRERPRQETCQLLDGSCFGEPRKAFDQKVAVGEEADEEPLDHGFLSENRLSDLLLKIEDRIAWGHVTLLVIGF